MAHVKLTGKTLYFAERHLTMSDGNFYDGRLKIGRAISRFQSITEPRPQASSMVVHLSNEDGGLNSDLVDYVWGLREVNIYAGEGLTFSDYSLIFTGFVRYPTGIVRTQDSVSLTLIDAISRDEIEKPDKVYTIADFPNMDTLFSQIRVPIVYGDFTASPTNTVPTVCINTTSNLMEVAGHTIGGISQVFRNGVGITHSLVQLGPRAQFTIATYVASSDLVTARVIGKTGTGVNLASTTTLTHPVDQLYDFMVNESKIPTSRINLSSFIATKNIDTSLTGRRVMRDVRSSGAWEAEILNEYTYDMTMVAGCYTLSLRQPSGASTTILDTSDLIPGSFRTEEDPQRTITNFVNGIYNYDAVNQRFIRSHSRAGLTSQVSVGATIGRELPLYWHYEDVTAHARINREVLTYQIAPEVVNAEFKHRALLLQLTDAVELTVGHFDSAPMQVREKTEDWERLRTSLTMWHIPSFEQVGRWTAPTAPSYFAATIEQQKEQGFWLAEDGTAGLTHTVFDAFTGTAGAQINSRLMDRGGTWTTQDILNGTAGVGITISGGGVATAQSAAVRTMAAVVASSVISGSISAYLLRENAGSAGGEAGIVAHYSDFKNLWYISLIYSPFLPVSQFTIYRKVAGKLQTKAVKLNSITWADAGHSVLMTVLLSGTVASPVLNAQITNLGDGSVDALTVSGDSFLFDKASHGFFITTNPSNDMEMYVNDFKVLPGSCGTATSHFY